MPSPHTKKNLDQRFSHIPSIDLDDSSPPADEDDSGSDSGAQSDTELSDVDIQQEEKARQRRRHRSSQAGLWRLHHSPQITPQMSGHHTTHHSNRRSSHQSTRPTSGDQSPTTIHIISNTPVSVNGSPPLNAVHFSPIISSSRAQQQHNHHRIPAASDINLNIQIASPTPSQNLSPSPNPSDISAPPEDMSVPGPSRLKRQSTDAANNEAWKLYVADIAYHLVLIYLCLPNATNALCGPSSIKPSDISAAWWSDLSFQLKVNSTLSFLFNLGANVSVQKDYIPQAFKQLSESFKSKENFIKNIPILLCSFAAAFAFAAMSFDAFLWAGLAMSIMSGASSLVTSFITRFPGVKKASDLLDDMTTTDENKDFQKEIVDRLSRLTPEAAAAFEELIRQNGTTLDATQITILLHQWAEQIEGLPVNQVLLEKTFSMVLFEKFKKYSVIAFGLLMFTTAFQTFTQKGFDGTNVTAHIASLSLDDLGLLSQFLIGLAGGLVSASLYYVSAVAFLPVFINVLIDILRDWRDCARALYYNGPGDAIKYAIDHPERLIRHLKILLSLFTIYFSSDAMATVGNGIANNPNGIFVPTTLGWSSYRNIFGQLNRLGGGVLNGNSIFKQLFKEENAAKKENPHLADVIQFLIETPLPPTTPLPQDKQNIVAEALPAASPSLNDQKSASVSPEPPATFASLRKFSIFSASAEARAPQMTPGHPESNPELPTFDEPDEVSNHPGFCERIGQMVLAF